MSPDIPTDSKLSRLEQTEELLERYSTVDQSDIELSYYKTREFATPSDLNTTEFKQCEIGFTWERERESKLRDRRHADIDPVDKGPLNNSLALGQNVWFHLSIDVPESMSGHPVYLRFVATPLPEQESAMGPARVECLCFQDGSPVQAFDAGHQELLLTESATGGERFELLVEAGTTTLWGLLDVKRFKLKTADIVARYDRVQQLRREYTVLNDVRKAADRGSPNWKKVVRCLLNISHEYVIPAHGPAELEQSVDDAMDKIGHLKSSLSSDLSGYDVTAVGHAHIDLAWLWPWSETVRKAGRTFSTMLKLVDEYPSFSFSQSQPPLYEFQEKYYPDLTARMEEAINTGQWHPTGALWVESDINLASGESIARQFLYGKRFFREKYDMNPEIVFLPDVFGYSGSLPDIASAADCPYFFTQKIDWNETNDFPYTSFNWEGVGGSTILTHFPPIGDYNGDMSVEQVQKSVTEHDENHIVDKSAYLVGWGDGGGGTTRDMIEKQSTIDDIGSMPDVSFGSLQEFFSELSEYRGELPKWSGELYLEKHRGTLTSQADVKQNNRKNEQNLRDVEIWSSLSYIRDDTEYPKQDIDKAWKILLFNQFHDILPGSSVSEVYADAEREHEMVSELTGDVIDEVTSSILPTTERSDRIAALNTFSWERTMMAEINSDTLPEEINDDFHVETSESHCPVQKDMITDADYVFRAPSVPGLSVQTFTITDDVEERSNSPLSVSDQHIANSKIRVEIGHDGRLEIYDKSAERYIFDQPGNSIVIHPDYPEEFDAWDFEADLYQVEQLVDRVSVSVSEQGPVRATVTQTYRTDNSEVVQHISLKEDSKQVSVRTEVDWHEDEAFLRARFPLDIQSTTATYDIHYANITRDTHTNTSWNEAQYEEPHHDWVDVSDKKYGVAILSDSKYGVHVSDSTVSLSLLRAPGWPDEDADRGHHEFTYAIKPHDGTLADSDVIESGKSLNVRSTTYAVNEHVQYQPISIESDSVVIDAVKIAEGIDDAIVIRAHESLGHRCKATIHLDFPFEAVYESNLIEDVEQELEVNGGVFTTSFSKFDIRTYIVVLDR